MTSQADVPIEAPVAREAAPPAALPQVRLFYWSVRRELWEHRAVWIAPAAIAVLALAGFLFSTTRLPHTVQALATLATAKRADAMISIPYVFVAVAVIVTGLMVAVFYCLAALHNERRDRSILFWKSLPVSDLITVLAKVAVPMIVIPVATFVIVFAAQLIMMAVSTAVVLASGLGGQALWAHIPLPKMWWMLAGGVPSIALWYAPLYGWLILISAWARRTPFLWALSPIVLGLVERLALGTHYVWAWLGLRLTGVFAGAFRGMGHEGDPASHAPEVDPASWSSPHLWIGLVLAVVFLAAAVRLRRSRDPI
jgi:ABC-2 type transport system permease protein